MDDSPAGRAFRGRRELLRLSMNSWPSALGGVALMTLVVAASFLAFSSSGAIWLWAAICLSVYGLQAMVIMVVQRRFGDRPPPSWFARVNLVLGAVAGSLWGALTWIVPSDPQSVPLMAALACGVQLLGAARTPSSMAMLRAIGLPGALVSSAGLAWHAGLSFAGATGLVLMLIIVRHGRQVRNELIEVAEQRRRLELLSAEVQQQQMQLRESEREQAVLNERQRLLRDMHDGLGASLVLALKMIEEGRLTIDEAAVVLRECLDDLRLVIDSLEPFEHNLVTLLATLRYRLGGRLDRAGIAIEWSMCESPALTWMNAPQALEVLRIVQEALTNVLKHARASRVRISLAIHADVGTGNGETVCLTIEDNGVGFDGESPSGRGLQNMRHRAHLIGAALTIDAREGTALRLLLPVDGAGLRPLGTLSWVPYQSKSSNIDRPGWN